MILGSLRRPFFALITSERLTTVGLGFGFWSSTSVVVVSYCQQILCLGGCGWSLWLEGNSVKSIFVV
ncbi:hypothetical protein Bca52824_032718 [Brassica carinata]|uniref:Uncharacterized protein n=1 Tax=Brassica carinata TaxID=52824 RepID=A0A8X7V6K2_BRACI|nr:hypothetical protein Bca52824_032718 [Brassica carinata]